MTALGIIFSSIHNETVEEITRKRTSAAIPFGGRYRLIDFPLSNFINAGVKNVGVLVRKNYASLMDHIGSGVDWDLARKNGGLRVFPPFASHNTDYVYQSRLEALRGILPYLNRSKEDVVILTDSDSVNVINYTEALAEHEEHNADMTLIYKNMVVTEDLTDNLSIVLDKDSKVTKASLKSRKGLTANVVINACIINRELLITLIYDSISNGASSFHRDIIFDNVNSLRVFGYEYKDNYVRMISLANYYKANLMLLNKETRDVLFNSNRRIYTKVSDSAPTRYGKEAKIENSFIADGCEIEGTVINSVLFRGVKVAKGTVIKNSVLMDETKVGSKCELNCVITDKRATITDNVKVGGCEKQPYYLSKNLTI